MSVAALKKPGARLGDHDEEAAAAQVTIFGSQDWRP